MWSIAASVLAVALALQGAPAAGQTGAAAAPAATAKAPEAMTATIAPKDLARLMAGKHKPLIFDVREPGEFAVSHLARAVRVDLAADPDAFVKATAPRAKGAAVVFYCTVGARSAQFANRVDDGLLSAGAKSVHVLRGGIFAWHDERRPLYDARGRTKHVHPYDIAMAKMLKRPGLARMKPRV
jgi:rhodanese-related sulfurtransferase